MPAKKHAKRSEWVDRISRRKRVQKFLLVKCMEKKWRNQNISQRYVITLTYPVCSLNRYNTLFDNNRPNRMCLKIEFHHQFHFTSLIWIIRVNTRRLFLIQLVLKYFTVLCVAWHKKKVPKKLPSTLFSVLNAVLLPSCCLVEVAACPSICQGK